MTEREKIIEIIAPFISAYGEDEAIADALISAGIGDVKEKGKEYRNVILMAITSQTISSERSRYMELNKNIAEHRAEVAERALLLACANLVKDEKDNVDIELLTRVVYTKFLRKAEKELAEEK